MQLAPQPSKSVFRLSSGQGKEEPVFFWRPFSNLPARHVLDSLVHSQAEGRPRDAHALFLGCTDPRTIIKSLAGLQLDKGSQQLQLTAVLNDVHASTLARTALLLLMAAELDPDSKADMRLLYDVWFNTIWHTDTWPRFAAFTQRLIDGSVPWLMPARRQDQQQLQEVWRWWLDEKHPNRPTPAVLGKARSCFNERSRTQGMYKIPTHVLRLPNDKYPTGFRTAVKVLHNTVIDVLVDALADPNTIRVNYESTAPKPPHVEQARQALCAVLDGATQYTQTGSLSWDGKRREAQGSMCSPTINITFVEPGTGAWNVHPDQQPFTCWGTYTAEELTTAMQTGLKSGDALADVFITRMACFVQRFQGVTACATTAGNNINDINVQKQVVLQVQLMCGEGLGLCLNQLQPLHNSPRDVDQADAVESMPGSDSGNGGGCMSAPFSTFDVIDTGSLCDDVGLLPLLVAVTPRLSNHPSARLHTVPATWAIAAPRMDYYLQEQALGMPLTMTPTVLGLRLVTDIQYGRPTAVRNLVVETAAFDPRELAWAPLPPSQPRPRLLLPDLTSAGTDQYAYKDAQWGPPGSIGAVLQTVCKLCCTNNHHALPHKYADVAVSLSSPHTLAWLLASCIPRLDVSSMVAAQQSSDSSISISISSCGPNAKAAEAHRALWALRTRVSALLPAHFRLAFQGAMDAVRASLQAATGPAAAEAAGVPACNHQSFLMLPISELEHGGLAVAGGVRLRRPYVRALVGAHDNTMLYTCRLDRVVKQQPVVVGPGQYAPGWHISGHHVDHVYEFAYEGSRLDPPPTNTAVANLIFPGATMSGEQELKLHVLDCCSVPYSKASGWRAAFMVPSDHASMQLPDVTSMLVSVGPDYFGRTTPQKHKFMDVPIQAVSPVLAQCFLHPLLYPPATCTAHESSHDSPLLTVTQLDETAWDYRVKLQLPGPAIVDEIGIDMLQAAIYKPPPELTGVAEPAGLVCPSSHVIQLHLRQPADASARLVLGWPVAAGLGEPEGVLDNAYSSGFGVSVKQQTSEGVMELTLKKAQVWELWPEDGVPPPFHCKPLTPHPPGVALVNQQLFMYTAAGSFAPGESNLETAASHERNPRNPLRSFIAHMLSVLATSQSFKLFLVCDENDKRCLAQRTSMYILVKNEWQVDVEDGYRVVLPALVLDFDFLHSFLWAEQLLPDTHQSIIAGVSKIIEACIVLDGKRMNERTVYEDTMQALNGVRRYLWHNAQRWQPDQWQQLLLSYIQIPAGPRPYVPPCYATCITPMFVEHQQQLHHSDYVFKELFPAGIPHLGQPLPYPLNTQAPVPTPPSVPTAGKTNAKAGSGGHRSSAAGRSSAAAAQPSAGDKKRNAAAKQSSSTCAHNINDQPGVTSTDHEAWLSQKMSELRVDFSQCTDEELRSMAEIAYGMYTHALK